MFSTVLSCFFFFKIKKTPSEICTKHLFMRAYRKTEIVYIIICFCCTVFCIRTWLLMQNIYYESDFGLLHWTLIRFVLAHFVKRSCAVWSFHSLLRSQRANRCSELQPACSIKIEYPIWDAPLVMSVQTWCQICITLYDNYLLLCSFLYLVKWFDSQYIWTCQPFMCRCCYLLQCWLYDYITPKIVLIVCNITFPRHDNALDVVNPGQIQQNDYFCI